MVFLEFIRTLKGKRIPTIGRRSSFEVEVLDEEERVIFILATGKKRKIKFDVIDRVLARQERENSYITSDYRPAHNISYNLALIKLYRRYELLKGVPLGNESPDIKTVSSEVILRDKEVVDWVIFNADGFCENCNKKSPFIKSDMTPYLEVHHVKQLALGGPDTPQNTIAVCPNCHKEFHFGIDKEKLIKEIYKKISRLKK